jgi:hypothetical protein
LSGGFLQTRASARTGCPGVAASSRVLHTRQDWPLVPSQCCRLVREVRFASDNLTSSIIARTLRSAGEEGCSPPCLVRGSGANRISQKQCGPGGWPGPHLFSFASLHSPVVHHSFPDRRCAGRYACRCATKIFFPIFFKRSPPECRREDALIIFRFLFAHANFTGKASAHRSRGVCN